jgi:hypothetical protein
LSDKVFEKTVWTWGFAVVVEEEQRTFALADLDLGLTAVPFDFAVVQYATESVVVGVAGVADLIAVVVLVTVAQVEFG